MEVTRGIKERYYIVETDWQTHRQPKHQNIDFSLLTHIETHHNMFSYPFGAGIAGGAYNKGEHPSQKLVSKLVT